MLFEKAFWKWEVLRKTQEVIGGNIEKTTKRFDIIQIRLVFIVFKIGNLSLGHAHRFPQFRLIQFRFLSKKLYFFSKCQRHSNHHIKATIDTKLLFTFR